MLLAVDVFKLLLVVSVLHETVEKLLYHLENIDHTSYLSRTCGRRPCKFFLASVNFYRFNAKIGIFDRFHAKKWRFFTDLTQKIGVFRCKFYSPKILPL